MNDTTDKKKGYLRQAWLVILLAILYGGALAGVQTTLGPVIAENRENEALHVIPTLLDGGPQSDLDIQKLEITGADGKPQYVYKVVGRKDTKLKGWVLPASGQGFADRISLLVGLNPSATTITGLYVLDQKETPGLGNFIAGDEFRGEFVDKLTDEPIEVVKGVPPSGNQIQALTGATISSRSVAKIVNTAMANLREPIRRQIETTPRD